MEVLVGAVAVEISGPSPAQANNEDPAMAATTIKCRHDSPKSKRAKMPGKPQDSRN